MGRGTSSSVIQPGKDQPLPQSAHLFQNTLSPQWIWARQIAGNPPIQGTRKAPVTLFLWRWRLWCVFLSFYFRLEAAAVHQPPTRLSSYVILRLICGLSRPFCRQTCRCPIREREIRRRERPCDVLHKREHSPCAILGFFQSASCCPLHRGR